MRTIYKYKLPIVDSYLMFSDPILKVLHVGEQNGEIFMWALVSLDPLKREYMFSVLGTGHDADGVKAEDFVGTVQMKSGLVWHVFFGEGK